MHTLKDKVSQKLSNLFADSPSQSASPRFSNSDSPKARLNSSVGKSLSSYFSFIVPQSGNEDCESCPPFPNRTESYESIEICKHGNGQNQAGSIISIGVSSIKSFSWQKNKRPQCCKTTYDGSSSSASCTFQALGELILDGEEETDLGWACLLSDFGWACVVILESLAPVMVDPVIGKSRLLFTPSVKKKAKDIAETWKKSLEDSGLQIAFKNV